MGILDDYLNSPDTSAAATSAAPAAAITPAATPSSGGIIDQYMSAPAVAQSPAGIKRVYIDTTPKLWTPEDEANAAKPHPNPRDSELAEGIANFPAFVGNSLKNNFMGGINEIGSGVSNKSPSDIGLGALRAITAIPATVADAVAKPVTELTGDPDTGNRAGFVASAAVPVAPGLGLISNIPTSVGGAASALQAARPSVSALKDLVESIGPENLPAVVNKMKANPRLGPADLSPKVLQDTQHLFANDGPQINYLATTSTNRMATAKDAVNSAFNSAMGPTVNAADKLDQLKAAARKVGQEAIQPVLQAKPQTDVTDLINHIDSEINGPNSTATMRAIKKGEAPPQPLDDYQKALLNVRNKLRGNWPDREQMFSYTDDIHKAQSALREEANGLSKSAVGSERNLSGKLFAIREKMKDAVGPEYKDALGKYADEKQIEEAFHYGHDSILKNGKTLENDPSFFEKWVKDPKRKPAELEAAKEGARRAINAEIQGTRTAATNPASRGTNIAQVDFNRQRLTSLLGKEEADKLLTKLEDTRLEANTHNKIVEGSQTAMRTASKAQFALPTKTDFMRSAPAIGVAEAANHFITGTPGIGTAAVVAGKGAAMAKDAIALKLAREHNLAYAKLALPTQGPKRDALIKSLEAAIPGPKKSLLTKASNLARLVAP